jgi:hypothetical protein
VTEERLCVEVAETVEVVEAEPRDVDEVAARVDSDVLGAELAEVSEVKV